MMQHQTDLNEEKKEVTVMQLKREKLSSSRGKRQMKSSQKVEKLASERQNDTNGFRKETTPYFTAESPMDGKEGDKRGRTTSSSSTEKQTP